MPQGIMGKGGLWYLIEALGVLVTEGSITNKSIYAFSFLVGKHRKPQSINAKLFVPIRPFGIVAYAVTLLWDNLCRNSCIHSAFSAHHRCASLGPSSRSIIISERNMADEG